MDNNFTDAINNLQYAMAKAEYDMNRCTEIAQENANRKRQSEDAIIKSATNIDTISKNVTDIRHDLSKETVERTLADKKNRRFNFFTLFIAILGVLIGLAAWLFPIAT